MRKTADTGFETAREALKKVVAVVPHTDADGLAAGAIALRARGESSEDAVLLERGQMPFGPDPPLPDGPVAVLDWGVRPLYRSGLIVDHHAPETAPRADQVLVSNYGEQPEVPTAALMRRVVPEAPAWIAALGAVGDVGDAAFNLPECRPAPKTAIRKLVPLINAPRRVPDGPVRLALTLLMEHDSPSKILTDRRISKLREARDEWRAEYDRVVRTAPIVRGEAAVIRFSSPCQVHPLVAAVWARRLAPRVVIVANDAYLPGRVNFAVRGGTGDLRAWLRNALPDTDGEFAHGHDRATGGSITPEEFERLVKKILRHPF